MIVDQLAPDEPLSPKLVSGMQAWDDDYPWLRRAFNAIGPSALAASDSWRARIEDELKTTLDFKVRPDGTAAVWCGMSGYDFHHDPTPEELFEGLREAYRRELERVAGSHTTGTGRWRMSACAPGARPRPLAPLAPPERPQPQPPARTRSPTGEDSLARMVGAVLLPRMEQLSVIFLAVTALTLILALAAVAVR